MGRGNVYAAGCTVDGVFARIVSGGHSDFLAVFAGIQERRAPGDGRTLHIPSDLVVNRYPYMLRAA